MKERRRKSPPPRFEIAIDVRPESGNAPDETTASGDRRTQSVVGRLLSAQEEERRGIAREMHDNLGSKITEVTLLLHRMNRDTPVSRKRHPELTQLTEKVMELAEAVRALSRQLHSPVLKFMGIVPAVESLCAEFEVHTGIRIRFVANAQPAEISNDVALCLYRVVQESLTNIARHSGANKARVKLMHTVDQVQLTISDPGKGFSPKSVRRKGLGFISMQERVRLLHGALQIRTRRGSGTEVHTTIPLNQASFNTIPIAFPK